MYVEVKFDDKTELPASRKWEAPTVRLRWPKPLCNRRTACDARALRSR